MKIAVYVPAFLVPQDGGAYGYVHNLFFKYLPEISGHEFVLIVNRPSNFSQNFFVSLIKQKYDYLEFTPVYKDVPWYVRPLRKLSTVLGDSFFGLVFRDLIRYFKTKTEVLNRLAFDSLLEKNKVILVLYPFPSELLNHTLPYVYTVYDIAFLNKPHLPEFVKDNEFLDRHQHYSSILPRAARILAESNTGRNEIKDAFGIPQSNISVVPLPAGPVADIRVTKEESTSYLKKIGVESHGFIFYPAQFWPHKNHLLLIKALDIIANVHSNKVKLLFPGSDKGTKNVLLQEVQKRGLSEQVIFLGFISDKELRILYENALCMAMPTLIGPTNMPIVEALCVGCPVLCSELPGHREQAQDAAIYFNPVSADELVEAILLLMDKPELRHSMIEKGKNAYEQYTKIGYVQRLVSVLSSLEVELGLL